PVTRRRAHWRGRRTPCRAAGPLTTDHRPDSHESHPRGSQGSHELHGSDFFLTTAQIRISRRGAKAQRTRAEKTSEDAAAVARSALRQPSRRPLLLLSVLCVKSSFPRAVPHPRTLSRSGTDCNRPSNRIVLPASLPARRICRSRGAGGSRRE